MITKFTKIVHALFNTKPMRDISPALIHSLWGLTTEVGEITDLIKKHVFYGKPFTNLQIKEELGDLLFYIESTAQACDSSLEELMELIIAKHKVRYPNGNFNAENAIRRNKIAELTAMEKIERKYNDKTKSK